MSGYTAAGADPEKPHTVHNGRVPKQSQDEEDIEAQESVGTASDGSGDSTDIPVEGGMTVAFKVCLPSPTCNSSPVPCKACADASIRGGKTVTVFSLQFVHHNTRCASWRPSIYRQTWLSDCLQLLP